MARFVVGAFRADAARAGAVSEVGQLVDELCQLSPEFEALWRDNNVTVYGEGIKRLRHPILGQIGLEYSAFAVDGRPDLGTIRSCDRMPTGAGRSSHRCRCSHEAL